MAKTIGPERAFFITYSKEPRSRAAGH